MLLKRLSESSCHQEDDLDRTSWCHRVHIVGEYNEKGNIGYGYGC